MSDNMESAKANATGWLESIEEMLSAQDWQSAAEAEGWTGPHRDKYRAVYFESPSDGAQWACAGWRELCEAFDIEPKHRESSEQAIHESVLEVCVRNDWRMPGQAIEDDPEEYYILLTTGGPALRIYGRLDAYNNPKSAELQMQDWGTPWTRYPAPEAKLLAFAQHFYFGE